VPTDLKKSQHEVLFDSLKQLGKHKRERLCVTYVYASWGFLVIPPLGFLELKISFYHQTSGEEVKQILALIDSLLTMTSKGSAKR